MLHQAAIDSYDKAIAIKPDYAEAYYNRGNAHKELKQYQAAVASYDQAIAINPNLLHAYFNRGVALKELRRYQLAITSFDAVVALKPDFAEAYYNRGNAHRDMRQYQTAVENFDRAIALRPNYAEAYRNRSIALGELRQFEAAIASYDKAIALNPDADFLHGIRCHLKMQICNWVDSEFEVRELLEAIQRNERVTQPFPVLALSSSLTLQLKAAKIWAGANHPNSFELGPIQKRSRGKKIRLGYFSADYHNHATAYLTARLFEWHDRSRFELVAFSFGPDKDDEMRRRISSAFDDFLDVRNLSDQEVAMQSRSLGIDIAIDLKGFTQDGRVGIFSCRAAPLQVSYLGYPGSIGAEYMDYLIADLTLIPQRSQQYYSEKIVYLPNSYQVNDSRRKIGEKVFTREELGLPDSGFVFCCFNNNYKITPGTFDRWMRILKQVDESVLWLIEDNPTAAVNLRKEAEKRGVQSQRLVFANRMPNADHLARHRAADLFIDTLPCNAHTTASDALWAGLPVLTCTGEAFASRVAASLLTAIDLPELITTTLDDYETLAVHLATHPERLETIRKKLDRHRLTTPLFDSQLFTKHVEDAYQQMMERYHEDLAPDHIYIFQ